VRLGWSRQLSLCWRTAQFDHEGSSPRLGTTGPVALSRPCCHQPLRRGISFC
jgi:hypothetical protein